MTKIKLGKTFTIADIEFINLGIDKAAGGIIGVSRDILFNSEFGTNNNFAESLILQRLKGEVLPKLEEAIGTENLFEFSMNLKSVRNPNLYADLNTKIGLPTLSLLQDNIYIFDLYRPSGLWYLGTANNSYMSYFASANNAYSYCDTCYCLGVRPMCIFNPELFEAFHSCKYCGQVTEGIDEDILCEDCREMFGHTLFSQL